MPPLITTRRLTPADQEALWELLYYAVYVPAGSPAPPRDIVRLPELARYAEDWGKPDDVGLAAVEADSGHVVGAAWLRLLTGKQRGYGYVDDSTPELSMALLPAYRGQGIGTRLLSELLEAAKDRFHAISLSVHVQNPVLRLYRRMGFEPAGAQQDSLTMLRISA